MNLFKHAIVPKRAFPERLTTNGPSGTVGLKYEKKGFQSRIRHQ